MAKTFRELRKARGLTREELAKKADIYVQTVYNVEHGKYFPRWTTIQLLADALEVTPKELMMIALAGGDPK